LKLSLGWSNLNEKVRAFNAVASVYDDWYEHPQGKQVFLAERNAVDYMIPIKGIGLEVGSGTGAFLKSLENEERIIIGLDPSTEMIAQAKEKNTQNVLGYGHHAPFRKIFDFIYMVTVIEFLEDPVDSLKALKLVGKYGSTFSLLFINSESCWGELYKDIGSKGDKVFRFAKLYNLAEIKEILGNAGFTLIEAKGTLLSGPMNPDVIGDLVEQSVESGVIITKSRIHKSS